jgi:hypothetical protein
VVDADPSPPENCRTAPAVDGSHRGDFESYLLLTGNLEALQVEAREIEFAKASFNAGVRRERLHQLLDHEAVEHRLPQPQRYR